MPTEEKLWLPSLSPKEQEKINRMRRRQKRAIIKGTGFSDKMLWDWLQLLAVLAIPVVVALASILFSQQQSQISQINSQKQHATDLLIANDQQQEAALQTYLDRMSTLLLDRNLSKSKSGDEVRNVTRAETLIVLQRLDSIRKGLVLQFLNEARLISVGKAIVDLNNADLSTVILSYSHINPKLKNVQVITKGWISLTLQGGQSSIALQPGSEEQSIINVQPINVQSFLNVQTNLSGVELSGANLEGASMYGADLSSTDLSGADLRNADLRNANLQNADLSYANLQGASIGNVDLLEVKSLKNAIMPDGSKHP